MLPQSLQTPERLEDLKESARKLGIEISYTTPYTEITDNITVRSGFCRLRNQPMVILDKNLVLGQQMEILLRALSAFDLDQVYLPYWIREQVESLNEKNLT